MAKSEAVLPRRALPAAGAFWRGLALPCLLTLAWLAIGRFHLTDSRLFVPLDRVLTVPFLDADGRNLWLGLAASVGRMLAGFALGAMLGGFLGLLMGLSAIGNRVVGPSFTALRQITLFAWIPLLTAWFGHGEEAKLVFIALSALFPMALNTHQGLHDVPPPYRELARVLRLTPKTRLMRLMLPGALPSICLGLEIALINAWIGTVAAEYAMGFGRGLGTFLAQGRELFRMDVVIVGVLALALTGFLMNCIFRTVFKRLMPWTEAQS